MSDNQKWSILQGDALKVLGTFAPNTFDAVITDPPYASGGRTQAEKNKSTARKYSSMGENAPPPFDGDAKDQRSWTRWAAEWLYEARKVCKSGAPVCMFIDWRQLPAATDALQWAGWIWRGTAVWDKGNSRPQKGRFRQQAEYIVWGSNGDMPISRPVPCLPGVFKYGNPQSRIHLTEKPLQLMRDIVKITEPGGHILDPFAGSGTTAHAVLNMNKADGGNRKFILVEMMDYADSITAERVRRVIRGYGEGKNAVDGTGGSFSYYELGPVLLLPDGNLNEEVGPQKIREYVYYMETKEPLPAEQPKDEPYFMGLCRNTAYYFYYERESVTTLDHAFLATIQTKAEGYTIYADLCAIPQETLRKHNITFKKIPRDIARL